MTDDLYREAIDEALVCCHLGIAKGNPKKELNDIVNWHVAVALDPRVSEAAQALIDQGKGISETLQQASDMLGDVPGDTLLQKIERLIGDHLASQLKSPTSKENDQ